jgi:uncharacterized protein YkwD
MRGRTVGLALLVILAGCSNVSGVGNESLNQTELRGAIHEDINDVRTDHGLPPVAYDPQIERMAENYSERMATEGFYSHVGPNGSTLANREPRYGVDCLAGENLMRTTKTSGNETKLAQQIVSSWLNSSGHRANILREAYDRTGIGVAIGTRDGVRLLYVTQNFCG